MPINGGLMMASLMMHFFVTRRARGIPHNTRSTERCCIIGPAAAAEATASSYAGHEPSHMHGDWRPMGPTRQAYAETYAIPDSKSRRHQIIACYPRGLMEIILEFAAVDEELTCSRGLLDGAHELGPRRGFNITPVNVRRRRRTARIGIVER